MKDSLEEFVLHVLLLAPWLRKGNAPCGGYRGTIPRISVLITLPTWSPTDLFDPNSLKSEFNI